MMGFRTHAPSKIAPDVEATPGASISVRDLSVTYP